MTEYGGVLLETVVEFPGFKTVPKGTSTFMKLLGYLLFFNKEFMSSYTTTIGSNMYTPTEWDTWTPESKASILRHERVHLR